MKFLSTYTIMALLLFSACKKVQIVEDEPDRNWGETTATRNGVEWVGGCRTKLSTVYPHKFSLTLVEYDYRGRERGSIFFRYLPYHPGTYFPLQYESGVNPDSALTCSSYTRIEGDIAGDKYVMFKDSAVVITIDSIDALGYISGTFSGSFVRKVYMGMIFDPASPDTFIYEGGKYRARVVD